MKNSRSSAKVEINRIIMETFRFGKMVLTPYQDGMSVHLISFHVVLLILFLAPLSIKPTLQLASLSGQ